MNGMVATPDGLGRRSVGTTSLWFFGTSASAPMTVLAGGVITAHAVTGVVVVAPSFLVLMAALLLFAVGFVAMSRDVPHAASFSAFLTLGLGRPAGLAGAAVALLAYNSVQIALYGLLGATTSGLLGGPWWVWALAGWLLVAALGILHVQLNARVIGVVLIVELAVIAAFDIVAFCNPADPAPAAFLAPLIPDRLLTDGVGGVLAFGIAAFTGFESIATFREEARDDDTVKRAALVTLLALGLLYTVSSWALVVVIGPGRIVDTAREQGSAIPFTVLDTHLGPLVAGLGLTLLVLSVLGAMISFHNVVARYVFALSREGVLPARLGVITGTRGGVPAGGSVLQSAVALLGIGVFALTGADPLASMFTWLATLSAVAVMTLMITACVAVLRYYRHDPRPGQPELWTTTVAPVLGAAAMTAVLTITLASLGSTVGDPRASAVLPAIVAATAATGAGWALWLRRHRPGTWAAIGRGQPPPLAVLDRALARYEL